MAFDECEANVILVDVASIDPTALDQFEGREWLAYVLRRRASIGFDIEWRPDRDRSASNPVALMQLADNDTALLLRTHRSKRWLPEIVQQVLKSSVVRKACVGYGGDRRKMELSV